MILRVSSFYFESVWAAGFRIYLLTDLLCRPGFAFFLLFLPSMNAIVLLG